MMRSAANFDSPVAETGDELSPDDDFIALSDETLIGWIKFGAEGELPERHQGLLYQGFVMPPRESLGDTDEGPWPEGLSGQPADPWQHQVCLVLQSPVTQELFTFSTTSQTGPVARENRRVLEEMWGNADRAVDEQTRRLRRGSSCVHVRFRG